MQTEKLIQSLVEQTKEIINHVETLREHDLNTLTWKVNPESWSILECLEHLNLYGDFYLPEIANKIKRSTSSNEEKFNPGFLGNYFAKSMLPKEKLNKMKTFKDKNPLHAKLDKSVIEKFINQQTELLKLLNQAKNVSLNKVKIATSISRFIQLKLGDTFRFFINHQIRHMKQIENVQAEMKQG